MTKLPVSQANGRFAIAYNRSLLTMRARLPFRCLPPDIL